MVYKILFFVYGFHYSQQALEETIERAKALNADVTVLYLLEHVEDVLYVRLYAGAIEKEKIETIIEQRASETLEEISQKIKEKGINVKAILRQGRAIDIIHDFTKEGNFDLFIIANRGHDSFGVFSLDDITSVLIQYVKSSILIVKGHEEEFQMQRILLAVDGSEHSFKAAKETVELAKHFNAEVTILSVIPELSFFVDKPENVFVSINTGKGEENIANNIFYKVEEKMKKVLEEVQSLFKERELKAKTIIKSGVIPEVICNEAKKRKADLVIMGKRSMRGQQEPLLGAISNKVAEHAEANVQLIE